jgi:hypothetical protein
MMTNQYLLKPAVIGRVAEITITEQEYADCKRCHKQIYEAFEIELAFDFMVSNYIEIEKYIAEHLVLDMVGATRTEDAFRLQQWGFVRTLNNWLASMTFWCDLTKSRLVHICGRGTELAQFCAAITVLKNNEFESALLFHLRNYSQHNGFPLTGSSMGDCWDKEFTLLSASYTLDYEKIRSYFEAGGRSASHRKQFGKQIKAYSKGKPFDLKPIIRKSVGLFGKFMDQVRISMAKRVSANETFVLDMITRFKLAHPGVSVIGLAAMPVDVKNIVKNRADIVPVRDEFIARARAMREKNKGTTLASMEKRIISNL